MTKFSTSTKMVIAYAASILLSLLLFSCNPYKKIMKNPPDNVRDSARLATRCSLTFPCTENKIIDTVEVIKGSDSIVYFKDQFDSLQQVKNRIITEVELKYKDTCTSAVNSAKDVCDACYKAGFAEGKSKPTIIERTIRIRSTTLDKAALYAEQYKLKVIQNKRDRNKTWKNIFLATTLLLSAVVIILFKTKR